ncbi:MAG TPA: hypothetical protein VN848_06280 [Gemmatimonadales bacterium]|nr:hypothetical protein [Gemmatimonadales bacterium]
MRVPILAAWVLSAAACTTQSDIPAPASYIATNHPKAIWVENPTTAVRVDYPHVDGDTIRGVQDGRPFAMRVSDMTVVSVRRIDWIPTALMAAGTGLALYAVVSAAQPKPCYPIPCPLLRPFSYQTCSCS